MNNHKRWAPTAFWATLALLIAGLLTYCVVWCGSQICSIRSDRAYGFASPEHGKRHAYHGILYSYWDAERGRWSFERDGQVCKL